MGAMFQEGKGVTAEELPFFRISHSSCGGVVKENS
jgi:hypothetical protein